MTIEGSVSGLPVEVARQAIEDEHRRRKRALVRWVVIGVGLLAIGVVLGLPPSEEEVRRGAETTPREVAGVLCLFAGFMLAGTTMTLNLVFVGRVRSTASSPLGEGEVTFRLGPRRNRVPRVEVVGPSGGRLIGRASCRARGWRDGYRAHPAQLFGSATEGGYLAAVVWLPDGSTRVIGVGVTGRV